MNLKSLGYRTDLIVPRFGGEVVDKGDYIVVRTPSNPSFFWGNFLIFSVPPAEGDFDRWRRIFVEEIGAPPEVNHVTFAWDAIEGEAGVLEPFIAAGFDVENNVVLTTDTIHPPSKYAEQVIVRPLTSDMDWEQAVINQIACRDEGHEVESYSRFKRRQMANYQAMTQAGSGYWFGAFLGDQLVGDCGIFQEGSREAPGEIVRFQAVGVHPEYRRRGICGSMVYHVARFGLETMNAKTLVMIADAEYHAAKIYESVGFRPTEKTVSLQWYKRVTANGEAE